MLVSNVGAATSGYHEIVAGNITRGLDAWGSLSFPVNDSSCVGFKATGGCSAKGTRQPSHDVRCAQPVHR